MLISPAKALKIYKVSKPTMYADMKSGKLSFTKDDRAKRKLDVAELERLYPKREEKEKAVNENVRAGGIETKLNVKQVVEIELEKQMLEQKVKFLEAQVKDKEEMIERWHGAFDKAQNTADKITLLLEDRTNLREDKSKEKIETLEKSLKILMDREDERRKLIEARRQKKEQERKAQEQEKIDKHTKTGFWYKLFA